MPDIADSVILAHQWLKKLFDIPRGAVVDDDDFKLGICLTEKAFQTAFNIFFGIKNRNDDRN